MAEKFVCPVDGCGREITEGCGSKGGLPVCPRCRAASYDLKALPKSAVLEKRKRYQYWENRMDYLQPEIVKMMADADRRVTVAKKTATARAHH